MRIISGRFRGRKIDPPSGRGIRPTTDRAREALFNILANHVEFEGLQVLDLFCGSGAVAMEFLSRGAAQLTAVERDRRTAAWLRELFRSFDVCADVVTSDAARFLAQSRGQYDLVFLDPPYALKDKNRYIEMLFAGRCLNPDSWVVLEHPPGEQYDRMPGFWEARTYSGSVFSFFFHGQQAEQELV